MSSPGSDERAIRVVLLLAGAPPVIGAIANGGRYGASFTIGALMIVSSIAGELAACRRRVRLPRARLR